MKPYLSVIIPCLNEELFLPNLLQNLNSQSFTDFEVIVADGKSEDQTTTVAKKFPAKFPLSIISTSTRNVSFQRNLGAKKSTGKILIFFDADTQIPSDYLEKIVHTFQTKKTDFLTTYIKVNSDNALEKIYASLSNLLFEIGKTFKTANSYGAMQAVRKEAFEKIGGYDIKTKFGEDEQLFEKLYRQGYKYRILKTPKYIFSMRRFQSNGTLKAFIQQLQNKIYISINGYHSYPKKKYQMGGQQYHSK